MARFPPLLPSAPFPVWVTVWVSGFPAQDLHRYKQERASCLNSEKEKPYFHPQHKPLTVNRDFGDTGLPTVGWGKQSTWLAASGSLAHLRAQPAPTPGGEPDDHRKAPVTAVWALCASFGVEVEAAPLSRYLDSVGPCVGRRLPGIVMARESQPSKVSNSRGRILPGSPVSGPYGAFDFSTRIKGGGRKRPPPGHKAPRCGAFPAFAEGAPFRHSRWF